ISVDFPSGHHTPYTNHLTPPILPAETVRTLAAHAKIKPVRLPAEPAVNAEPGYRPSMALSEFIRWRDLTCRFPGCDAPAERCDIDRDDGVSLAMAV
ncbi:DUF222 domain-containing protein, partial [Streptomyces sp. NPDC056002]|uniref:DUF222 domain-containing protein n=1 Tax=Streptomyces sp. NPDC056002 TaxID=3345675 RepID=UPI0035D8023B